MLGLENMMERHCIIVRICSEVKRATLGFWLKLLNGEDKGGLLTKTY